jgi:hypothetical protein
MAVVEGFLAWIVGIAAILIIVWRVGVKIERRIGEINTMMAENIQKLSGDRRVLEERVNNSAAKIDKIDSRLDKIEDLAWESSPLRAGRIRKRIEEEKQEQEENKT